VRFEPGQSRVVELCALAGDRLVYGFTAAVMGPLDQTRRAPRTPRARKTTKRVTAKRRSR